MTSTSQVPRERDHFSTGWLCTAGQAAHCTGALSGGSKCEPKSGLRLCLLCFLCCGAASPEEAWPLSDLPEAMFGPAATRDSYVTPPCRGRQPLLFPANLPPGLAPRAPDNSGSAVAAFLRQMRSGGAVGTCLGCQISSCLTGTPGPRPPSSGCSSWS